MTRIPRVLLPALIGGLGVLLSSGCVTKTRVLHWDGPGSVAGRVGFEGEIPRSWRAAKDEEDWTGGWDAPAESWDGSPPREIEITESGSVRGVAVWLEPAGMDFGLKNHTHGREEKSLVLEGSCIWPAMTVVTTGRKLTLLNRDARMHRVHFLSGGEPFNVGVGPGQAIEVPMETPGRFRLTCNDHAFMRADLVVVDSAWHAVSDRDGQFLIEDIPRGSYFLRMAHHRISEADSPPIIMLGNGGESFAELRARRGGWDD